MENKFLTKLALNRYEKHLFEGGATGSKNPHSAINRASEFLGAAKASEPSGNVWIRVNRGQEHGTFTQGMDSLTRESGHYAKVNAERKEGWHRLEGNRPGQSKGPGVQVKHLEVEKVTGRAMDSATEVAFGARKMVPNKFMAALKTVARAA